MTSLVRLLALGDSYTIGERVLPRERWVNLLVDQLREAGYACAPPRIIAQSGWSTDELARQMEVAAPDTDHAFATLMIGVNNQYRGRSAEEFAAELNELSGRAVALVNNDPQRLALISIPDWGRTPFASDQDRNAIAGSIDRFNGVIRELAAEAGATFIDVTTISRRESSEQGWWADDGLHPGPGLHRLWAEEIFPTIVAHLPPPSS